jgi:hypothetical protein
MTSSKKLSYSDFNTPLLLSEDYQEVISKLSNHTSYQLPDALHDLLLKLNPQYTEEQKRALIEGFRFGYTMKLVTFRNLSFMTRLKYLLGG